MSAHDSCMSVSDYYRRTYLEWRNAYGLTDGCMTELIAAMHAELERPDIHENDEVQLKILIVAVEGELDLARKATIATAAA